MGSEPKIVLAAGDVKQWFYCPRIAWFRYVRPVRKKETPKMAFGKEAQDEAERLEKRRGFARYNIKTGARSFGVALESERLGFRGVLDMLITTAREAFPVEFKRTRDVGGVALGHKYQLCVYALLVEDEVGYPVRSGFVQYLPSGHVRRVSMTQGVKDHVKRTATRIRRMITSETTPPRSARRSKCHRCEYFLFCGEG